MQKNKTAGKVSGGVLWTVVAVVIIAIFIFTYYRRNQHLARLTAEAPAEVLNVDVISESSSSSSSRRQTSNSYSTRISYRFTANGRTIDDDYTKSGNVSNRYRVGQPAKVCYNPSDPTDSEIFETDYRCGQ